MKDMYSKVYDFLRCKHPNACITKIRKPHNTSRTYSLRTIEPYLNNYTKKYYFDYHYIVQNVSILLKVKFLK